MLARLSMLHYYTILMALTLESIGAMSGAAGAWSESEQDHFNRVVVALTGLIFA
jgi:hypothetical protein